MNTEETRNKVDSERVSIRRSRFTAVGGPCWTGDCWGGALELDNASAIAWRQNTSGVKFGIGRTENGLFFFRTNSPLGMTTNGPIYDFKMDNSGMSASATLASAQGLTRN